MGLDALIGQTALVFQLKTILKNGKLGHTYAFSGPEGMGKRTFAFSFAKEILCLECHSTPCRCISCTTFQEGTNPDFYEVISEKSSIGVDLVRELQSDAANRPFYGSKKVYFIDHAETMTTQAQNCLLKTLEEPPKYAVILLSVTQFKALLPTIQSRTVNLRMRPYNKNEMLEIISHVSTEDGDEREFAINFSQGVPGNALHLLEESNFRALRQQLIQLILKPEDFTLFEKARKRLTENREELETAFNMLMSLYRDCLMVHIGMENMLINSDKKDIIKEIALSYSKQRWMEKLSAMESIRQNFRYNINYHLGIDVFLMEIQEV